MEMVWEERILNMSKYDNIDRLYRFLGEKTSIENLRNIKRGEIPLNICALIDDDEFYWTSALNINAVFRISKKTFEMEYMGSFPDEERYKQGISYSGVKYGNKIYFAPYSYNKIAVYDMEKRSIKTIDFDYPIGEYSPPYCSDANFADVVAYKNWLFFIPGAYPAIIRLDVNSEELTYISDWVSEAEDYMKGNQRLHWTKAITIGNKLYAGGMRSNTILEFNMDSCETVIYEVGDETHAYGSICSDGKKIWLSPKLNHGVVVWDIESKQMTEMNNFPDEYEGCDYGYGDICLKGEKVWMFPTRAKQTLFFENSNTQQLSIDKEFQGTYTFAKVYGNKIYAFEFKESMLISYNINTGEIRKEKITCKDKAMEAFLEPVFREKVTNVSSKLYRENSIQNLEAYLEYVLFLPEK